MLTKNKNWKKSKLCDRHDFLEINWNLSGKLINHKCSNEAKYHWPTDSGTNERHQVPQGTVHSSA